MAQTYCQRSLEGNLVILDALDGSIRNSSLAILEDGSDVARFPSDRGLFDISR